MRRSLQVVVRGTMRRVAAVCLVAASLATLAGEARAIEMFTFFGDGSRIGLPSLEVPIEAYPGIPLRSDRIRARNRALEQQRRGTAVRPAGGQSSQGVTIRSMPVMEQERIPVQAR